VQWSPQALTELTCRSVSEVASGLPILSLTLDDADLNDPARGLSPNKRQHGEEWEREGSVSYFDAGKLMFASGVGVRIHGGSSRLTAPRPGFRLYFRRKYGPRELPSGRLFSAAAQPRTADRHPRRRAALGKGGLVFCEPARLRHRARDRSNRSRKRKPVRFFLNGE
jgi:hypothetical protein